MSLNIMLCCQTCYWSSYDLIHETHHCKYGPPRAIFDDESVVVVRPQVRGEWVCSKYRHGPRKIPITMEEWLEDEVFF